MTFPGDYEWRIGKKRSPSILNRILSIWPGSTFWLKPLWFVIADLCSKIIYQCVSVLCVYWPYVDLDIHSFSDKPSKQFTKFICFIVYINVTNHELNFNQQKIFGHTFILLNCRFLHGILYRYCLKWSRKVFAMPI